MERIVSRQRKHASLFAIFIGLFILCLLLTFPSMADVPVHFIPGTDFTKYDSLIAEAALKYRVDFALVKAVIKAESNFNHKAVSKKGAKGLMQLMPKTASILRVNDCFHPEDNIIGGIRHLGYLIDLFNGDIPLALAAYNAGEGVVARYGGVPPYSETRNYIRRVLDNYERYRHGPIVFTGTG